MRREKFEKNGKENEKKEKENDFSFKFSSKLSQIFFSLEGSEFPDRQTAGGQRRN